MTNDLYKSQYNPDVLSCLANLSNDEVFTPPGIVNQMLEMLPEELWQDKNAKFLDPACKSGVFLREIAKRLLKGLEDEIPNLEERINHIFQSQLYGIAITELTSLLSRRSVYCSKYPNSIYSVSLFDNPIGNIRFKKIRHKWQNGKCIFCGASKSQYDRDKILETHAYEIIHTTKPEDIFKMKFDVIIGNPPYQLSDAGAQASAIPLYHKFVLEAKKLNPRFLTMVIPSRWFAGGKGLNEFRDIMLNDKRIRKLVDYPISSECFPGVSVKGGICYFLWDRDNVGICEVKTIMNENISVLNRYLLEKNTNTFIRFNESIPILNKVRLKNEASFASLVSSRKPFGLPTNFKGTEKDSIYTIKLYETKNISYINPGQVLRNKQWVKSYKVYITESYGAGEDFPHQILNKPILGEPNTCCTETYLLIGPFESKEIAENILSYIKTRFFRFMILLLKNTQHATKKVYSFVTMQDFSKPWTDKELYFKYGLTDEEIAFIESMIRPMDLGGDKNGK